VGEKKRRRREGVKLIVPEQFVDKYRDGLLHLER